jgi:hypothetical protein
MQKRELDRCIDTRVFQKPETIGFPREKSANAAETAILISSSSIFPV